MDKSVFLYPKRQNHTSVQYALFLFGDGIRPYVDEKFRELHSQMQQTLAHVTAVCNHSCSLSKNKPQNWCYTCSSWRTAILGYHNHRQLASTSISRKKLDSSLWPTSSAEVMKCFYPDWCFSAGVVVDNNDVAILLNCISYCNFFNQNVQHLRDTRNDIAHRSHTSNIDKTDKCDIMLKFLQDPDICKYKEAQAAIKSITILKDNTLKDIYDKHLLDEQSISSLERQCYEEKSTTLKKSSTWNDYLKKLVTVIVAVLAICSYPFLTTTDVNVIPMEFRLQFDTFIDPNKTFTGRDWLFNDIQQKLQDDNRGIMLIAEPGYGKTAIVEQLVLRRKSFEHYDILYHFCRDDSKKLRDPASFILNIVYSLYTKYPQYKTAIDLQVQMSNGGITNRMCKYDTLYCALSLIIQPLNKIKSPEDNLLIIVDSLDRCSGSDESIEKVLKYIYLQMPHWAKLLLTMRNNTELTSHYEKFHLMHLKTSDARHKKDFENHMKSVMKEKTIKHLIMPFYNENDNPAVLIDLIKNLSAILNHDFLFYDEFLKYRLMKKDKISYLSEVPPSIVSIYEREMSFLFGDCSSSFDSTRIVLEIISASFEPLTKTELLGYTADMPKYQINEIIHKIFPHLLRISETAEITFRHPLFMQWLTSKDRAGFQCFVDIQKGHTRIADKMFKIIQECGTEPDGHCTLEQIHTLLAHIHTANESDLIDKIHHLPSIVVDRKTCTILLNRTFCLSVLDIAAKSFNSYKIMQSLLQTSSIQDFTSAAIIAIHNNNNYNLKAILETKKVDVHANYELTEGPPHDYLLAKWVLNEEYKILHGAIEGQNIEAVKLIIQYDARTIQYTTAAGYDPLSIAIFTKNVEIVDFLSQHVVLYDDLLRYAYDANAYDVFMYLLKRGLTDRCIPCNTGDISLVGNTAVRFNRHNKTLVFKTDRIPDETPQTTHTITRDMHFLMKETTCESILHTAVRQGNNMFVRALITHGATAGQCRDFQGLEPYFTSWVFMQQNQSDQLSKVSSQNYVCSPTDVRNRMFIMRKLNVINRVYTDLGYDEYCSAGSTFGHLLTLNFPCDYILSLVKQNMNSNLKEFLTTINEKEETPLYWLLCKNDEIESSSVIAGMLLMSAIQKNQQKTIVFLEWSFCNLGHFVLSETSKTMRTLCNKMKGFPAIKDIYLQTGNSKEIPSLPDLEEDTIVYVYYKINKVSTFLFSFIKTNTTHPRSMFSFKTWNMNPYLFFHKK